MSFNSLVAKNIINEFVLQHFEGIEFIKDPNLCPEKTFDVSVKPPFPIEIMCDGIFDLYLESLATFALKIINHYAEDYDFFTPQIIYNPSEGSIFIKIGMRRKEEEVN